MVKGPPTVKIAMTPFPHSIERSATVLEARALMEDHKIRHLPVTDGASVCGVVTHRDIDVALAVGERFGQRDENVTIEEIGVREPFMVSVDARLDVVAKEMTERRTSSAVVTKQGKLVGIFTSMDACRALGKLLQERFGNPDDDPEAA